MPRVRPAQRQQMEANDTWGLFKARKKALQDTGGCTPAVAHRQALAEFCHAVISAPSIDRAQAVKVTAIEVKFGEVGTLFEDCEPCEYGDLEAGSPLRRAWEGALNALCETEERLDTLGDLLREGAEITWKEAKEAIAESQEEPAAPAEAETVPA